LQARSAIEDTVARRGLAPMPEKFPDVRQGYLLPAHTVLQNEESKLPVRVAIAIVAEHAWRGQGCRSEGVNQAAMQ
jgi:hypothetical protein